MGIWESDKKELEKLIIGEDLRIENENTVESGHRYDYCDESSGPQKNSYEQAFMVKVIFRSRDRRSNWILLYWKSYNISWEKFEKIWEENSISKIQIWVS